MSSRWRSTSAARTSGRAATSDARALTSGVRISAVTSSPSSVTPPSKPIAHAVGSAAPRRSASAMQRYIAPVSRYVKPSAAATARATVDLPAPAGPSMAMSIAAEDRSRRQPANSDATSSAKPGSCGEVSCSPAAELERHVERRNGRAERR